MDLPSTRRLLEWLDLAPDPRQHGQLSRYADWLAIEAVQAGGIGPEEVADLDDRHVADSVAFLHGLAGDEETVVDVGTGAGLPGVPLAVLLPEVRFVLVDRAGRRVRLVRRAIRILGLENVEVVQAEHATVRARFDALVSRACSPPSVMSEVIQDLVRPGGRGVLAGSRVARPEATGYETVEVAPGMLDRPLWLLMMARP